MYSQEYTDAKRAEYICEIPKYITWPNKSSIKEYKICILDNDSILYFEILKLAKSGKLIHGKSIVVLHAFSINNIPECNLIFANSKKNFDLGKILNVIDKNVFLISENYEFHKSMLNFIIIDGKQRFELNEKLINSRGFTISPLFTALAVKTKADWEALYVKTEDLLEHEIEVVSKQKTEIEQQKLEIRKQQNVIDKQKDEIVEQKKILEIQKKNLAELIKSINEKQIMLNEKISVLKEQEQEIKVQKTNIEKQADILEEQSKEIDNQVELIGEQKTTLNNQLEQIEKQKIIMYFLIFIVVLVLVVIYFIYRAYKIKKLTNKLLKEKNNEILQKNKEISAKKDEIEIQNAEIIQQKEEIEAQRDEIERQRDEILFQHDEILHQKKEITDSILYARRIQNAVLPPEKFISKVLQNNFFILNKPRDIVSGDYYWIAEKDDLSIFAVADCTGHGVPGAFMSMLGVAFLNEIVNQKGITQANEILNLLRDQVMKSLHQTGKEGEAKDGMDIALCVLDNNTNVLQFSGANNPLYVVTNYELQVNSIENSTSTPQLLNSLEPQLNELKGDKMPIGIYIDERKPFTNNVLQVYSGDCIYIFSDGYADQFGGIDGKKFKYKKFKEMLIEISVETMEKQHEILDNTIEKWKGNLDQVDDICVFGIKIS